MGQRHFAKRTTRRFAGLLFLSLLQPGWTPVGPVSPAQAQVSCPNLPDAFSSAPQTRILGTGACAPNIALPADGPGLSVAPTKLAPAPQTDTGDPFAREFGVADEPHGILGLPRQRSGKDFDFSLDMKRLTEEARKASNAKAKQALPDHDGKPPATPQPSSRWNAWASGHYEDFDDDPANTDRSGHLWSFMSGPSLRLDGDTSVGVFSRYREGNVESATLNAEIDAEYYGGGVFVTTTAAGGLSITGTALFEYGDNDIEIDGAEGRFASAQRTLQGTVDKRFDANSFWIDPSVTISYSDADNGDYTDSRGNFVSGQDLSFGRLTYGPTIGTKIQYGQTEIRPFAKMNGIWDFANEGDAATSAGALFASGEKAIDVGNGVEVAYDNGLAFKIAGDWIASYTALEGWTVTTGVGAPLSALGGEKAGPGTLSIDFTGKESEASAKARLRIPLGVSE